MTSGQRPAAPDFNARKRARQWADSLSVLAAGRTEAVARHYGVETDRGPYRLPDELVPAKEAEAFALTLADWSLQPVQRAFAAGDPRLADIPWEKHAPTTVDSATIRAGLPLLLACSDDAPDVATKRSLTRSAKNKSLNDQHDYFARLSAKLILWEQLLWHIAADHGGPSSRMPYATTFHALEWFWEPSVHKYGDFEIPCLRCGQIIEPKRIPKDFPQCDHCTKNSNLRKPWPGHAIAPAERGTWLLRCQSPDCTGTGWFLGHAQRLRCDTCPPSSAITPAKRTPRRSRPS